MQEFNFYRDEKCSVWTRQTYKIQADTYEEAVQKVLDIEAEDNISYRFDILEETLCQLTPDVNQGEPTIEIYSRDTENLIFDNGTIK